MAEWIDGYRCLTPMRTAGSGSARWCVASRGLDRFFLKEFLSPVYPARVDTELDRLRRARCERFEDEKQALYAALSCVIGDTLVPVIDFFRFERHYYAVSELAPESHLTADALRDLPDEAKRKAMFDLALCLQRLHTQGVVHADLKPEHVLLLKRPDGYQLRLIDLDSGFCTEHPPESLECDPAYLAPESFLRMTGREATLGTAIDTFAFGALIHRIWTGELPSFDRQRFHSLYEAVLSGDSVTLSKGLPLAYHRTVRRMLAAQPEARPGDAQITALFAPQPEHSESAPAANSLSRFYHPGRF